MMRKIVFLIIFLSTILLVACSKEDNNTLPITMPNDFAISYSYGIDKSQLNIIDTYKGTIQKNLVLDGIADIDYLISENDLEKLYSSIRECKIHEITLNMTSKNLATNNSFMATFPCVYYYINFIINGIEYNVVGDNSVFGYINTNKQAENFYTFVTYITGYLASTQEYKSLPEMNGGYD